MNIPEFILDMDVFESHVKQGRLEIEKGIHSAEAWLDVQSLFKRKIGARQTKDRQTY
jgi:hypothetical protein